MKTRLKIFYIKCKNSEYWPSFVLYIPVVFIWLYHSVKLRSFLYFTVVNPTIDTGGFIGESKIDILRQLSKAYYPKTLFIKEGTKLTSILKTIGKSHIQFPLVLKPNIGDQGYKVIICNNVADLRAYFKANNFDTLIQEYIDYNVEYSLFFYIDPITNKGKISSLCEKVNLTVVGNGQDTVAKLMEQKDRALLQLDRLTKEDNSLLSYIPSKLEKVLLDPIANHRRGALFKNVNDHITSKLVESFNTLSEQTPDFKYIRYDLKCKSLNDLENLKYFSILEINGITAEPAHIYDPEYKAYEVFKDLACHWLKMTRIAKKQIQNGLKPMSMYDFYIYIGKYNKYKRKLKK